LVKLSGRERAGGERLGVIPPLKSKGGSSEGGINSSTAEKRGKRENLKKRESTSSPKGGEYYIKKKVTVIAMATLNVTDRKRPEKSTPLRFL